MEEFIMVKKYKIEVDCANCAAKVEREINKIKGVNDATINFMTQKLILDADDEKFDEIFEEVKKRALKVEKDMTFEEL